MSNSTEVAYNLALARLLRHEGLNAQGEQRRRFGEARGQADVLLDFDDYAVVIEAEFGSPAKADADRRFPPDRPAMVGGLPLRLAVAVGYPERLADLPESDTDANLAAATDLTIAYRYWGEEWRADTVGTVASLAEQLRNYWVQSDNGARIEEIVKKASTAIDGAAEVLARLDRDRGREPESPGTKALIWLNALVFQELLARLADEALDIGGRLAFVLPATMLTGSRWAPIRRLLLSKYAVEWVVVSHDLRNRTAKKGLPGRRLVSFSESTRIAEVLIVATRRRSGRPKGSHACFVNLLRNPDEPIEALGLTRKLLALRDGLASLEPAAIEVGETTWGNAVSVPQADLPWDGGPWSLATFVQPGLALIANRIASGKHGRLGSVLIAELGSFADLGPYHMQVKNPKYGLFTVRERPASTAATEWSLRAGIPALWHHKAGRNTCLAASADALLERRADRSRADQDRMLAKSGCLHLPADLGMAPQRVAAVMTDNPMLGFSSWISVVVRNPQSGKNEALCLWLNSTFGLLLRIMHGNRPYLGRSRVPYELARTMPVLDVDRLSNGQLTAAAALYADLKHRELKGFSALADDPVRCEMNERLCREVLDIDPEIVADITRKLALEPTLHARH